MGVAQYGNQDDEKTMATNNKGDMEDYFKATFEDKLLV